MSAEVDFHERNAELSDAIDARIKQSYEDDNTDTYVIRSVVITEYFQEGNDYPTLSHVSFGRDGSGLNKWEAMGLVKATLLVMEHDYTHDE